MYSNIFSDVEVEDRRLKKMIGELTRDLTRGFTIDLMQSNTAMTIAESIALRNRLDALRNSVQTRAIREPAYVQEMRRPEPERDRPLPNRYEGRQQTRSWDYYGYRGTHGY